MDEWIDLPFERAVEFLRRKVLIPTQAWTDLWKEEHQQGFMVAGAAAEDIVGDFKKAVDLAIAEGITLREFTEEFDAIVERYGWSYNGGRSWRAQVIYDTNIRTAYAKGRWDQLTSPQAVANRPYLMYRHGGSANPRKEHLAWDGLILPHDDPWWRTHYPPNDWGCSCRVYALSAREIERRGLAVGTAPPLNLRPLPTPDGRIVQVPEGVGLGWDYNVGIRRAA